MTLNKETVQYLASTAVIAGAFGMKDRAVAISDALLAAMPDDIDAQVLAASAQLTAGRKEASIELLRDKVLQADPERTIAKALLGMAYDMTGETSSRDKLLAEVLEANDDPNAAQIAKDLMGR